MTDNSTLKLWDLSNGKLELSFGSENPMKAPVAISPDSKFAVGLGWDQKAKVEKLVLWTIPTANRLHPFAERQARHALRKTGIIQSGSRCALLTFETIKRFGKNNLRYRLFLYMYSFTDFAYRFTLSETLWRPLSATTRAPSEAWRPKVIRASANVPRQVAHPFHGRS